MHQLIFFSILYYPAFENLFQLLEISLLDLFGTFSGRCLNTFILFLIGFVNPFFLPLKKIFP